MAERVRRGNVQRTPHPSKRDVQSYTYIDGTAVRRLEQAPEQWKEQERRQTSTVTKKNRERNLQMDLRYVLFLTAAAVITIASCVNYVQLQIKGTRLSREIIQRQTQLDEIRMENESNYNRILSNVDMEHVKNVAMNELGMVYASKAQIVEYTVDNNDYVRQYSEVPEE